MVTHEIQKITINVFYLCSLFQTHPEVQDAFLPFQQLSKEDMEHSAILRSHALRVMGTVEKCIGRIKTPEKLENLMHELGERHTHYNARYDFVDVRSFFSVIIYDNKKISCVTKLLSYFNFIVLKLVQKKSFSPFLPTFLLLHRCKITRYIFIFELINANQWQRTSTSV